MSKSHSDFEQTTIKQFTSNYFNNSMDIDGVRILAIPQEIVSGDFHVVIQNEHSIYVLVADGAGHGLSAVMPGLRFPTMFIEMAQKGHSIMTIASKLNAELCQYDHKGYFIAITLAQINEHNNFIEVLNCGNPSALLVNQNGHVLHRFESSSLACGIVHNDDYELLTERIKYNEDARFYVFSDGIQDTLIHSGKCKNTIEYESLYNRPPSTCFDTILSDLTKAQSNEKIDDVTLIEINIKVSHSKLAKEQAVKTKHKAITLNENQAITALASCRVLCIEPDLSTRQSVTQSLTKYVDNIDLCATIDEANSAYQYTPSLIIIDLAFLLKYRSELNFMLPIKTSGIPIIITCEPSNIIVAEQLFSLSITRYIAKSLIKDELLTIIKDCMSLSARRDEWWLKSAVFQKSSLAMTIVDANKHIIRVNEAFCRITGYTREEVIDCNPRLLSSGKHDADFYHTMWHSINTTGCWSGEIWNKRKNGDLFLEWITINAIKNEYDELVSYCSVFADISERKAVDEAIKRLSYYDDLTELPNRRSFKIKLNQEIEQAEKGQYGLAVLFLDLDNFKNINDTLGHEYGDLVLKETAVRLSQCVRDTDLIARLGGDEFTMCISPSVNNTVVDNITKKILNEIATNPFQIYDEVIYLSVSIGVAIYPDHGTAAPLLLKHADQAMFYAKEQGRNGFQFFRPSMEISAIEKRKLIQDLRLAIKNKEFELFYQPIVELQTNALHKAEALIRWHHPEKGVIPPDSFIPIAEETDLINEIGDWVFKQAVCQSMLWRTRIHDQFQISINKSPREFNKDKSVHNACLEYLATEEFPNDAVAIEITEGVMMDSKIAIVKQLRSFHDKGIQISLDDFGTGYSSLSYLRKFDIDYIKIDRQFVQQVESSRDDQALCKAIIAMAHALDIKVIAEGIETVGQKTFLLNVGCDYGQGYLFSKPVPASDFEKIKINF
jgi:diguanylate cyclase (GGDEF)-like protein/PAS domain S-box-containing protein